VEPLPVRQRAREEYSSLFAEYSRKPFAMNNEHVIPNVHIDAAAGKADELAEQLRA
jgi:hypothetical protein